MQRAIKTAQNWYSNKPVALQLFIWIVVVPTIFVSIYYGFITSDVYVSEAKYALRSNEQTPLTSGMLDSILTGGSVGSTHEDATIVKDYILSHDMLEKLDARLSIRKHYESDDIDRLSRLDPDASDEDFLEYYRKMVGVSIDSSTNITTLSIRAFDPVIAKQMAKTIIELSEDLVNRLSERIVEDTLHFARNEVDEAEDSVRKADDALTTFRSKTQSIDPGKETSAVLDIVTGLERQLAEARTQLTEARSFMQKDSTQVKILGNKVKALEKQVTDERGRLASEGASNDYTKLIEQYQPLVLEQDLARQRYKSALTSLELARAEAQRKQRYLLPFVQPKIPDEAVEPKRFKAILTFFIALCLIYAISGLSWAAIKDHMRL